MHALTSHMYTLVGVGIDRDKAKKSTEPERNPVLSDFQEGELRVDFGKKNNGKRLETETVHD